MVERNVPSKQFPRREYRHAYALCLKIHTPYHPVCSNTHSTPQPESDKVLPNGSSATDNRPNYRYYSYIDKSVPPNERISSRNNRTNFAVENTTKKTREFRMPLPDKLVQAYSCSRQVRVANSTDRQPRWHRNEAPVSDVDSKHPHLMPQHSGNHCSLPVPICNDWHNPIPYPCSREDHFWYKTSQPSSYSEPHIRSITHPDPNDLRGKEVM